MHTIECEPSMNNKAQINIQTIILCLIPHFSRSVKKSVPSKRKKKYSTMSNISASWFHCSALRENCVYQSQLLFRLIHPRPCDGSAPLSLLGRWPAKGIGCSCWRENKTCPLCRCLLAGSAETEWSRSERFSRTLLSLLNICMSVCMHMCVGAEVTKLWSTKCGFHLHTLPLPWSYFLFDI